MAGASVMAETLTRRRQGPTAPGWAASYSARSRSIRPPSRRATTHSTTKIDARPRTSSGDGEPAGQHEHLHDRPGDVAAGPGRPSRTAGSAPASGRRRPTRWWRRAAIRRPYATSVAKNTSNASRMRIVWANWGFAGRLRRTAWPSGTVELIGSRLPAGPCVDVVRGSVALGRELVVRPAPDELVAGRPRPSTVSVGAPEPSAARASPRATMPATSESLTSRRKSASTKPTSDERARGTRTTARARW